jgi:pimeloyl-ACP methyl ester carboxylesterase
MKKPFMILPLALVFMPCFASAGKRAEEAAEELHDSQVVTRTIDIGGYRLYLKVMGEGYPAIIMDSGLGETSQAWGEIHPIVAGFAQAVSYDRAGLGQSEPGPEPRTPKQAAIELKRLLQEAKILPPYVLVGHSLGGIHILTFASLYPDDVAGLVFVDAKDGTTFDAWRDDLGQEKYKELFMGFERYYSKATGAVKAEWESLSNPVIVRCPQKTC